MKDETYLKKLGAKIVQIRTEKEISQKQLALNIGSTNTHLRRIERGEANPTINTLRRIAAELGISISDLVSLQ
jgi:putative transcriptional regulator